MSSSTKPVLFLVHGAWVGSFAYAKVIPQLWEAGYSTWCQELPFHNGDPASSVQDTIDFVRKELLMILDSGRDVIPVCWSFGAVIAPPAFKGLWKHEREKEGHKTGITGMVFASTPLVQKAGITGAENQKHWEAQTWFSGHAPPELFNLVSEAFDWPSECCIKLGMDAEARTSQGPLLTAKTGKGSPFTVGMYHSIDPSQNPNDIFDPLLRPLAGASHAQPLPYVPQIKEAPDSMDEPGRWPVPTAYFLTADDPVIPTAIQEKVVKKWDGQWAMVERFDCGHMLWVARTETVVGALVKFAQQVSST